VNNKLTRIMMNLRVVRSDNA